MRSPLFLIVLVLALAGVVFGVLAGPESQAAPPDPLTAEEFITLHLAGPQGKRTVRIPKGCRIEHGYADCVAPNGVQRVISLGEPPFTIEKVFDSKGNEIRSRPIALEELEALGIDLSHQDDTPVDLSSIPVFRPQEPVPPSFIAVFPEVPIPGGLPSQVVDGIQPPNAPILVPVTSAGD